MLQLGPPPVEAACRCGHLHHAAAAALHAEAPEHSDDESVDLPESPTCSKAELRTPRELLSLQAEGPGMRVCAVWVGRVGWGGVGARQWQGCYATNCQGLCG